MSDAKKVYTGGGGGEGAQLFVRNMGTGVTRIAGR